MQFPRLERLLGAPLESITAEQLAEAALGPPLREGPDLEFKGALYADAQKRELAKDVAAMANAQGGVIILGVKEKDGAAVEAPGVQLSEAAERRMEQILAANVFPLAQCRIRRVSSSTTPNNGFYILAVPRSPLAPHAVSGDRDALCYPRRHERTTYYLSESEVADAYRSRFRDARDQLTRLDTVHQEGVARLEWPPDTGFWLTAALVPNALGDLSLTRQLLDETRAWFEGVAMATTMQGEMSYREHPDPRTRLRRLTLSSSVTRERPRPSSFYAELHTDGSGFLARLHISRKGPFAFEPLLLRWVESALHILAEHAQRTGAHGDAAVRMTPLATWREDGTFETPLVLVANDVFGGSEPVSHQSLDAPLLDARTVNLDDCLESGTRRLQATRLLLTDFFQSVGLPEVRAITADGALDLRFFEQDARERLKTWAERNAVSLV